MPARWRPNEVFHGRYLVGLPPDLAPGRYALGVRVSSAGELLQPAILPDEGTAGEDGIVWMGALVDVVSPEAAHDAALADRDRAADLAARGRCAEAWTAWHDARMHVATDLAFDDQHGAGVRREVARCWLARSAQDPEHAVDALERVRGLDPELPGFAEREQAVADGLWADALALRDAHRWQKAYSTFVDVLRADPSRAWARRYAEEARDHRLEHVERTKKSGRAG